MPIYKCKVRGGEAEERLVRASSAAKARDHIVEATADEVATMMEKGGKLETAVETEGDPESTPTPSTTTTTGQPPENKAK